MSPPPVPAGSPLELAVTWEAGPHGVEVGGAVHFVVSGFWGWSPPQTTEPGAPGYTEVTAPEGVGVVARTGAGTLFATVRDRRIEPGERVTFRWSGLADRFAERAPAVFVGVDADGDGVRALVPGALEVTTLPGACAQLAVTGPSAVAPGDAVALRVAALDAVGNGPCALDADLALELPSWLDGPRRARVQGGLALVPLTARAEGLGVVLATAGGLAGRSNPLMARAGAQRPLWADLQIHTARSDGSGAPADVLAYARDVAGLDVAALTDHDHWGFRPLDGDPGTRRELREAASAATGGGFVAVPGMEWTSWLHGHRHLLFFGPDEPWPSSLADATDTPAELFAALRGRDVVAVPHHVAGGPVALDWSPGLDPLEVAVEVASVHGQSADPSLPSPVWDPVPGAFAEAHLREGPTFGLVASTDGHDGHPGLSQLAGGGGGLTALVGAEPTPEGVARALRERRTYATTGQRPIVRFDVGGTPIGGRRPAGDTTATVRVVAPAPVTEVEVFTRGGLAASRAGQGEVLFAELPLSLSPGDLVYLRVHLADGGLVWTSPIEIE